MFKQNNSNIKNYMVLLIGIFVITSIITNIFFFSAINKISIDSKLYLSIKASKDLKADMLPPKLYIVESYLLVQQIVNERDAIKISKLLDDLKKSREDYSKFYIYWTANMPDQNMLQLMKESDSSVREFYRIFDNEFMPALEEKKYDDLQNIVNSEMKSIFEAHRKIINEMSTNIESNNTNIEKNARELSASYQVILLFAYIISLLIIVSISILILRRVSNIESKIKSSQDETNIANERLEIIVDGLKKFKHNYDNVLASIDGYAMQNDMQGIKEYMEEIIVDKNKSEMINYFKLDFIKNPALTGLIISKMLYAERVGVSFTLKVRSDVSKISMKASHLCEVLGILLDNAIEGATISVDKKVNFLIDEPDESYIFNIRNSIKAKPERNKMFEKGWTSKEGSRGLGLFIAKEIIDKYDNVLLNSIIEEESVEQELMVLKSIPKEDETLFTDIL